MNFLDRTDLDDTNLDLGIFEEEEPEKEEQVLEQIDNIVVDKKTGEIVIEGDVLGNNTAVEANPDTADIILHMDDIGLTANKIHPVDANNKVPDLMPEKIKKESFVADNPIRKAISRMEYKYVKELEPHTISFRDCDFTEFKDEINEAQRIISLYYESGVDANLGRAEHDLGKLSAIMCRIGAATGYIQGNGEAFDRVFKNVRSACYTELKEMKSDNDDIKISDKDIENVAQVLAGTQLKGISKVEIQGKMIMNFWFALRKFIDILDAQIVRSRSEGKTEEHTEAAAHHPDPDNKPRAEPEPIEDTLEF